MGLDFSDSIFLNSSKSSFCFGFKFEGTSVIIFIYKSPQPFPLSNGIPLPFSLNCFPCCVPDGILILALPPSIEGTSTEVPKAASVKEIGNSKYKCSSDLLKMLWLSTEINKYKSPVDPPLLPASPLPETLILVPSSTPLGIFTETLSLLCVLPIPLHCLQGLLIVSP